MAEEVHMKVRRVTCHCPKCGITVPIEKIISEYDISSGEPIYGYFARCPKYKTWTGWTHLSRHIEFDENWNILPEVVTNTTSCDGA